MTHCRRQKEPVRILEKLVFEIKPKKNSDEDRFILKESISNIKPLAKSKFTEQDEVFIGSDCIDSYFDALTAL